jgi:hypothetical protein
MTAPSPPPLARTYLEAQLYLTTFGACRFCGLVALAVRGSSQGTVGQYEVRDIIVRCTNCGEEDAHSFLIPLEQYDDVVFGGPERSELLDPGDWLLLAAALYDDVPEDDPEALPAEHRAEARNLLESAVAAVAEAMKFLDPGTDAIGADAFWSEEGWELFTVDPSLFSRDRLTEQLHGYQALLRQYQDG